MPNTRKSKVNFTTILGLKENELKAIKNTINELNDQLALLNDYSEKVEQEIAEIKGEN